MEKQSSFIIDENFSCSLSNSSCCELHVWKYALLSPATEETESTVFSSAIKKDAISSEFKPHVLSAMGTAGYLPLIQLSFRDKLVCNVVRLPAVPLGSGDKRTYWEAQVPKQGSVSTFHSVNPSDVSTQNGALTQLPAISNYFPLSVFCESRTSAVQSAALSPSPVGCWLCSQLWCWYQVAQLQLSLPPARLCPALSVSAIQLEETVLCGVGYNSCDDSTEPRFRAIFQNQAKEEDQTFIRKDMQWKLHKVWSLNSRESMEVPDDGKDTRLQDSMGVEASFKQDDDEDWL
ncbi:hypothetical protein EK904_011887 [Melospiza melodia maxima]|nr:hypothetical protein EK904_011887 [Melospiza melodia maxima]